MAVGRMADGSGCHNMLAAQCACMQCGHDLSAISYERRVAHVKKCKPRLNCHEAPPLSSLLCCSTYIGLPESTDLPPQLCMFPCHASSAQYGLLLTSACFDTAGTEQMKQKADSKGHSHGSRLTRSADLRHLPGLDLCSGADSGERRGKDHLLPGIYTE